MFRQARGELVSAIRGSLKTPTVKVSPSEAQLTGGIHAQSALHACDHGTRRVALVAIPETGTDEGGINQPHHIARVGERVRTLVVITQQEGLLAAAGNDVDILADPQPPLAFPSDGIGASTQPRGMGAAILPGRWAAGHRESPPGR